MVTGDYRLRRDYNIVREVQGTLPIVNIIIIIIIIIVRVRYICSQQYKMNRMAL